LKSMLACLMMAIIPAALLSLILYPGGYLLAAIGGLSYMAPLAGLAFGYLLPRSERDIYRLMQFYTIINSVMLIGVPLEYMDFDLPALGGINMDWIRYRDGYIVDLMTGFYRSPDIMGLHAAHVIMFSLSLAIRTKSPERR